MLEHKTALVTGASRGIGRAIALALAEDGADVAVNYSGSAEQAQETVRQILKMGRRAIAIQGDVSKEEDCIRMFAQTEEALGPVNILVNNAGITRDGLAVRMSGEDFEKVLDVNLKGAFYCMKLAAKGMMKQRYGRIISISSISGVKGNPGQINYCAAKAGIIGMTKSLARELAGGGMTVTAIAHGDLASDLPAGLPEKVKESALAQIPLGRMGKPEDIAYAAAFLASDRASYLTGQVLLVDGGMGI